MSMYFCIESPSQIKKSSDAKRMSMLKHLQASDIRVDRSGKKEPSNTTDLRLLESSAKEVASIDV